MLSELVKFLASGARKNEGWKPGTVPSPNVRPLLLSLDGVDGSSHCTKPLDPAILTTARIQTGSLSVVDSPNGDFEFGPLPKTSRRDGCCGRRCSPVGINPATKAMETFTVQPRSLRKSRGLPTRTGDPNPATAAAAR